MKQLTNHFAVELEDAGCRGVSSRPGGDACRVSSVCCPNSAFERRPKLRFLAEVVVGTGVVVASVRMQWTSGLAVVGDEGGCRGC